MYKILVMDDNAAIRMLYDDELTEEGYEVVTCGEALRIMELIARTRPDIVVMDVRLGPYNGLELLQDIRNTYYELPIILCTGYPLFQGDLRSIAADYYLLKSSNLYELKAKIQKALQGAAPMISSQVEERESDRELIPMNHAGLPR
ncbi:response regulator [Thermodesulfobacteriota bacterium]